MVLSSGQFQALAIDWAPALPDGSQLMLEVRVSADGKTWGPWAEAHLLDGGPERAVVQGSDLFIQKGRAAQVRLTLTPGSGSLVVASVTRPRTPPPWAAAAHA